MAETRSAIEDTSGKKGPAVRTTLAALVRVGLEAPIAPEAGRRLGALGGTHPEMASIPRRRPA